MTTNFEKVREFHSVFQHPIRTKQYDEVFTNDRKLMDLRVALISEEVKELNEAVKQSDFIETLDAICDIAYVIHGAYCALGIDEDKSFDYVHTTKTKTKSKDGASEYEKVGDSYKEQGFKVLTSPNNDVFGDSYFGKKMDQINQSLNDLKTAVENKSLDDVGLAMAHMLYACIEISYHIGVNFDTAFSIVHDSNMTKACTTEQEAQDSVKHILLTKPEYSPGYKLSDDNKYYIVYDTKTGKTLKNKYYKTVDFSKLLSSTSAGN